MGEDILDNCAESYMTINIEYGRLVPLMAFHFHILSNELYFMLTLVLGEIIKV